jgi:prepilin peptidase CpaA
MDMPFTLIMSLLGLLSLCGLMVWAAVGDVRSFTITNKLNLVIAATFLVLAIPMGMEWPAVFDNIKVGIIASVIAIAMFYVGIFGGGDAKMIGAVAFWLGSAPMLAFIYFTALAGGVLGVTLIIGRRLARKHGLPKSPKWARRMLRKRSAIPYGVAIAIGALIAAPRATWFPDALFG